MKRTTRISTFTAVAIALTLCVFLAWPVSSSGPVQEAYVKASNPRPYDWFGRSVAVSGDTMVVGAPFESSNATGVNGDQNDNSAYKSGAAYVFVRNGINWSQQAYLKASNTGGGDAETPIPGDQFGWSVAIWGDTIVIGALEEDSNASGVNGNQLNNTLEGAGAAYIFVRNGTNWTQQAYLKSSRPGASDLFGYSVAASRDVVVVGAPGEDSNATGVNGNDQNNSASESGAAYVFVRSGNSWKQQAYLKAEKIEVHDLLFGQSVAISGESVVIGAPYADGNATVEGAAYVFARSGTNWSQQALIKASNPGEGDYFGSSVGISDDTVVISAYGEDSNANGVNGNQSDNSSLDSGAVYVFHRHGTNWGQQAYLKASNSSCCGNHYFGTAAAISGDVVIVSMPPEHSKATGLNGNQHDFSFTEAGAAYVFLRNGTNWAQQAYLKASNTGTTDRFGSGVGASGDTVVVGANGESSSATGVNGNQNDDTGPESGAAYCFSGFGLGAFPVGGGCGIGFNGRAGFTYGLERALSVTGGWTNIASSSPVEFSNLVRFYDSNAPPDTAFYRTVGP